MGKPNLLVAGHINLDIVADSLDGPPGEQLALADISVSVGGLIGHAAKHESAAFGRRVAVCALGDDHVGRYLAGFVGSGFDDSVLLTKESNSASVVSIVYREGEREMVGPRGSANDRFSVDDVESSVVQEAVADASFLIVDGYWAMNSDSRNACRRLLAAGRNSGAVTVFDVVPHRAVKYYSLDELQSLAQHIDLMVIELRTFEGFLKSTVPEERIQKSFCEAFPGTMGLIRYGDSNVKINTWVTERTLKTAAVDASQEELSRSGFGTHLLLGQLANMWEQEESDVLPSCHDIPRLSARSG